MTTTRLLSNRYELGDTLGYGGMSEVHRGRDVRLGREVAVKVLRADLARDPQFQERFRREAQNAAALNHPAIVAVYDTGETRTENGPLPYIVMEYVDGRTLRDIVKTGGPLPGQRAMEIMADVCAALDFSHRHGIVHRDVKPANIMITKTGAVKVMDFGIARAVADGQVAVTQTAAVIGTAQYLSPEQARGEAVDARSDVYATGCVLFELLTGEPPFTGDSPVAVAYQHVREEPKPPSTLNPRVSRQLDSIVLKAMSKNPANRYQSAAEMRMDLVRVLSGQRPSAPALMPSAQSEERTSVMGNNTPTTTRGRHRPEGPEDYDDPYEDEEERRRRRNRNILLVALAAIGLLAFIVWYFSNGDKAGEETAKIVDVKGMQEAEARSALQRQGFDSVRTQKVPCQAASPGAAPPCTSADIGKAIGTDPSGGSTVSKNQTIVLRVGSSPDEVQVPDVSGKSVEEARRTLEAEGLTVSTEPPTFEETTETARIGKIIKQNPNAGTSVAKGTPVKLVLGKEAAEKPVPNVIGQTFEAAKATLKDAEFEVNRQDVDSDQPKNTVVEQTPRRARAGSTITLRVSKGTPEEIVMPDLRGKTPQQAASLLQSMGWNGTINIVDEAPTNDPDQDGTIQAHSPEAGDKIDPDQRINVRVLKLRGGGFTLPTRPFGS